MDREAFQTKQWVNFRPGPNRRGRQKIKKVPSFSWEKFKIRGGVFGNQKSPKFQWVPKTNKIMTHFHLMRTQKHKILSIVVLNMAQYTIISLILTTVFLGCRQSTQCQAGSICDGSACIPGDLVGLSWHCLSGETEEKNLQVATRLMTVSPDFLAHRGSAVWLLVKSYSCKIVWFESVSAVLIGLNNCVMLVNLSNELFSSGIVFI